jgi:hypothetical protein
MRRAFAATLPAPCIGCGELVQPGEPWHLGHRTPRALGGLDVPANLGVSHAYCNLTEAPSIQWRARKASRAPAQSRDWGAVTAKPSFPTESPGTVEPSRVW